MTYILASESSQSSFWNPIASSHRISVNSVKDMVDKTLQILANNPGANNRLIIDGAGAKNYQSVGARGLGDATGTRSLQVDAKGDLKGSAREQMQRLQGRVRAIELRYDHSLSTPLCVAIGKALGIGQIITGGSLFIVDGKNKPVQQKRVRVKDVLIEKSSLLDSLWRREGGKTVEVKKSDNPRSTLSGIATSEYGDWKLWPLIYDLNQVEVGRNPNQLRVGQRLRILPKQRFTPQQIVAAKQRAHSWRTF